MALIGGYLIGEHFANRAIYRIEEDLGGTVERLSREIDSSISSAKRAVEVVEQVSSLTLTIEGRVSKLSQKVEQLTTEDISCRLSGLYVDLTGLKGQLDVLIKIINPENAQDILNVARMAEEIQERENFTEEVKSTILSYERKLERIEDDLGRLQYWISGGLLTIIAALFVTIAYLGRQYLFRSLPGEREGIPSMP
jgi:K+/H+ antiporter YhaU regulatory subunit KhtT